MEVEKTEDQPQAEWIERGRTECQHEWIEIASDPTSELISLGCTKCSSGINVATENVAKYLKRIGR